MKLHPKPPCDDCPFRVAPRFHFDEDRACEIAQALRRGESFSCHKTLDYSESAGAVTPQTRHCAGAMLVLEKEGRPNQLMQVAQRLGCYDAEGLRQASRHVPVYADLDAFAEATSRWPPSRERAGRDAVEERGIPRASSTVAAPRSYPEGGCTQEKEAPRRRKKP